MTVKELLKAIGVTPSADYHGEVRTNMQVLAVRIAEETDPLDFAVTLPHMENLGASIKAETEETDYLWEGRVTTRYAPRRTFSLQGKRLVGDAFQDWACSHAVKFGTGGEIETDYIYLDLLTGEGETGRLSIGVAEDGSGAADTPGTFAAEAWSLGTPSPYHYEA